MIESVRDGICHVSIIQICLPRSNLTAAMIFDVSHVRIVQVVEHVTILKVLNSIGIGIEIENNTTPMLTRVSVFFLDQTITRYDLWNV